MRTSVLKIVNDRCIEVIFLHRFGHCLRQPREGGLIPPVKDPAPSLLGVREAGTPQEVHMVRNRGLREPDRLLDIAGAKPPLFARDEVAAGFAASAQQLENLQPRRISERLENGDEVFRALHRSITVDISIFAVKCICRSRWLPAPRAESPTAQRISR